MPVKCDVLVGLFVLFVLMTAAGCGGNAEKLPVAETSGQVMCESKPVARAQVYFEPIQEGKSAKVGKQAFAFTDDHGKFVLSTYGKMDGAVVGKHRVRVGGDPKVPCDCVANSEIDVMQVEIEAGIPNSFSISLKKKTGKEPPTPAELEAKADAEDE